MINYQREEDNSVEMSGAKSTVIMESILHSTCGIPLPDSLSHVSLSLHVIYSREASRVFTCLPLNTALCSQ